MPNVDTTIPIPPELAHVAEELQRAHATSRIAARPFYADPSAVELLLDGKPVSWHRLQRKEER